MALAIDSADSNRLSYSTSIFGNRYLRTPNSELVNAKESAPYLAGSAAVVFLILSVW